MKPLLTFILILLSAPFAMGQIDVKVTKATSLVGVVKPDKIGSIIICDESSKPSLAPIAILNIKSDYKFIDVEASLNDEPVDIVKASERQFVIIQSGSIRVEIVAFDPDKGIFKKRFKVDVGPPTPPDPPGPKPPVPPGPPPGPVTSFHVILVKESGSTLNADQTAISGAKSVRDYLTAKTTPESGLAGWREYDPQQNVANEKSSLKALWAAAKSSITTVPCLVVEVNGKVSVVPYPKNVTEAMNTLKAYGGN